MSKTRLTSIQTISLTRLEPNVVVLGAMLYKLAIKEVHLIVQNSTLWTHLILVLKYIQKHSPPF